MKKLLFIVTILTFSTGTINAQNRTTTRNDIGWITTTITPHINKKLSGYIEYQFRRADYVEIWQQSLLRLGFNYKVHPQVTTHLGYGWILTFPYGEYNIAAQPRMFPEHRIYEQLVINGQAGKVSFVHRLRLEQRWLGRFVDMDQKRPEDFVYLNRVRYMLRADVPLSEKVYAAAYDEIFIGFGKNVGENIFDQNRIGILLGYKANSSFKIEGGFLNQALQLGREIGGKNVFQQNNGFIINTYLQLNND
ncbi:MAG: hypothetical protein K0Q79_1460 [Flavipsychrobacter sp.]|jgi:hypothetical protein|nr:hypothetical protein [Flavipsychrobacter sp.]